MKVLCGLGNPGKEYEQTRHNVGWWLLDHLADVWHLSGWRKDGDARVLEGTVRGHRVRLVKPLTFMNLSGAALKPYLRRAVARGMDALFIAGRAEDAAAIVPQLRRLGYTGPILGADGITGVKDLVAAARAANGRH